MKTTTQLTVAAVALFTSSFINVASVSYLINRMSDDGRVVNHAGIIRGATQRLVKLELTDSEQDDLIDAIERIIQGLIEGDRDLKLPPATDPNFLEKMQAVQTGWFTLKTTIQEYRNAPESGDVLLQESELFFELSNAAVFAAENFSKGKVQFTLVIQITLFLLNFALLVGICWVTHILQSQIKKAIMAIASSCTEIAAIVTQQEVVVSMQAASVHQTTTTTSHIRHSSAESAQEAIAAKRAASAVMNLAVEGGKTVQNLLIEMATVQNNSSAIYNKINDLKERTRRIETISYMVSRMANQTNLLALNAAIEAKRAGIDGKGFTIVAAEIRQLANHSKKSAEEIQQLIIDIQTAMSSTLQVTKEGSKTVQESVESIQNMTAAFQSVVDAIDEIFTRNARISLSAQEQVNAIQQVVEAMDSINNGAKETVNGISQTKLGMQQLNQAAWSLKTMV
ncbi:type IV pili methyl-accepting chemotaxis transducer N-terminal domain-containing protein [Phormidium pseudopriestleyi FRX01]|uniref:Type IV pili methyl-accepting chemotaxis transducer N-terminal domain-containing protein n=1 Tax=Phormidium pseudopriestleyi FRX01 TaxID=1759528 RepID=A0ABS3FL97_9CYAN|nr:methyl-accepting chemotaxis protein [Phormidium pseudopriestleyi]MBO0347618.1 type IV pili methyl-accepting chemotaxis transducer N-terminal domain-containing protein [Phormidium pseudopriestleyi FRX01]